MQSTRSILLLLAVSTVSTGVTAEDRLDEPATRGELSAVILSGFFEDIRHVAFVNGQLLIFYVGQGSEQPPESDDDLPNIAERSCSPQRSDLQTEAGSEDDPPGAGWIVYDYLAARLGYSIENVASILTTACVLPLETPEQNETICQSLLYETSWHC